MVSFNVLSRITLLSFFALTAVGCAAEATSETASTEEALVDNSDIRAGLFKLYDAPDARLSETVSGVCEIYVLPDTREYDLHFMTNRCGSQIFRGTSVVNGETRTITITDHRARLCYNDQPAPIVVEETGADGVVHTTYGSELNTGR